MKAIGMACLLALAAAAAAAEPLRVALLDFDNQATVAADAVVGGVTPKTLAEKGIFALAAALANDPAYVLIDRREFIKQIESMNLTDNDKRTTVKPSFLRAAQALNADVVLRGNLLSYSPGKRTVNPDGTRKTEFQTLTLRVALQALDTRDGAVIAMIEGAATREFRQSTTEQTVVSEDDLLQLLQASLAKATPDLNKKLGERLAQQNNRPKIKLTVKAGKADPALVEIDGLLIGTTPLVDFQVFAGDHVITIGKAGYQDISKQILLKADTSIEVPLFRTKLSAEEMKEVLDKARVNLIAGTGGVEPAWIINTIDTGK
jgi:hypothetical protein